MNVTISALLLSSALSNSPALIHKHRAFLSIYNSRITKFVSPFIYSRCHGQISVYATQFRNSLAPVLLATDEETITSMAITTTNFFSGRKDIKFVDCLFFYCHNSKSMGGGISVQLVSGKLSIIDSKFERCKSQYGCAGVSAQIGDGLVTGTCFDLCSAGKSGYCSSLYIQVSTKQVDRHPIQINDTAVVNCDSKNDTLCQESGKLIGRNWNFTHNRAVSGGCSITVSAVESAQVEFTIIQNSTTQKGGIIFSSEKTLVLLLQHINIIGCTGFTNSSCAFLAGKGSDISVFYAIVASSEFGSGIAVLGDITSQILLVNVRSDISGPKDKHIDQESCKWNLNTHFTKLDIAPVSACAFGIEMWESMPVPFFKTVAGIASIASTAVASIAVVIALLLGRRNKEAGGEMSATSTSHGNMFYREQFMTDFITEK